MRQYPHHVKPTGGMAGTHPEPAFMDPNTGVQHVDSGACCYGCGMSKKLHGYSNLCNSCFPKMGKAEDYIKIDSAARTPEVLSSIESLNNAHRSFQHVFPYSMAQGAEHLGASSGVLFNSCFIHDVGNIYDGAIMAPLTPFKKIWRLKNNGMFAWPQKSKLVWVGGDRLCKGFSFTLDIPEAGIKVDQVLDVAVYLVAPELPGQYTSYFQMSSPSGEMFGQYVWVLIQVIASLKGNKLDTANGFDLNSLPVHNNGPAVDLHNLHLPPPPPNVQWWYPSVVNPAVPSQLTSSYQPLLPSEMEKERVSKKTLDEYTALWKLQQQRQHRIPGVGIGGPGYSK